MKQELAIAMALLSVGVLAGFSAVPVQAVDPDCDEDFLIPGEQEDPETLAGNGVVTWALDVTSAGGEETVRVSLESNNDLMEFGIFEDEDPCERSNNVNTAACQQDVELSTKPVLVTPPVSQDCELDDPNSGTRTFYFVLENLESDPLEYTIFTV